MSHRIRFGGNGPSIPTSSPPVNVSRFTFPPLPCTISLTPTPPGQTCFSRFPFPAVEFDSAVTFQPSNSIRRWLFLVAALLAALYLSGRDKLYDWFEVSGWVALGLWLAGFLLSTFPAKFSWGVWIDFNEPRTQMTLRLLAVGLGFLLLSRWIDHRRFTAAAQIALSATVLFLNRSTAIVRHPLNPIGQADNPAIALSYGLIFLVALLISAYLIFYLTTTRLAQTPD